MNILQLAARLPYPLTDGGAIGIYFLTRALAAEGHAVTFVSFPLEDRELTREAVHKLSEFCEVHLVSKPLPSRARTLVKSLFRGAYPIERRMMPEMFLLLRKLLTENKYDVVHLDASHVGKYGLWIKQQFGVPVVLRQHNFENQIYKRFAMHESNPVKRLIATVHGKRLEQEEIRILQGVDAVAAITPEDVQLMCEVVPLATYRIVPAGVDTEYFTPTPVDQEIPGRLLWVGGMDWEPNRDALHYFLSNMFPLLLSKYPTAVLEIVGKGTEALSSQVSAFKASIILHGQVADVRTYFPTASVLVIPLRIGGGMRLKLLEFFSAAKAVVTSTIGAEGNLARDGSECLIRDSAASFVDGIILLFENGETRSELGAKARELVMKEYSWTSVGKKLTALYQDVLDIRNVSKMV